MADSPVPVPAKAVAQRLGISLGTSYRVLHTLEHAGYVVRLGHGCFGFSGKAASLTRQFQDSLDVVRAFRPALKRLAEEAEEDAYLALLRGGEIAVAEVIEGSNALHVAGSRSASRASPTRRPSARCSSPHAPTRRSTTTSGSGRWWR